MKFLSKSSVEKYSLRNILTLILYTRGPNSLWNFCCFRTGWDHAILFCTYLSWLLITHLAFATTLQSSLYSLFFFSAWLKRSMSWCSVMKHMIKYVTTTLCNVLINKLSFLSDIVISEQLIMTEICPRIVFCLFVILEKKIQCFRLVCTMNCWADNTRKIL